MNIQDRIVEHTITGGDAAALNNAVSEGDVYPVLVVNRTEADSATGTPSYTYGHLFYHGGIIPIVFQSPDSEPAATQGPEVAAAVNSRAADETTFAQPADTGHGLTTVPFEIPGTNGRTDGPPETEAEMEARLRAELTPKPRPAETQDEMQARLIAKIQAEQASGTVTGSEGRL